MLDELPDPRKQRRAFAQFIQLLDRLDEPPARVAPVAGSEIRPVPQAEDDTCASLKRKRKGIANG
ncbi:MAG: hypothetical protein ABIQ60_09850 [Burkholderiaceae bacterium]